MRWPSPPRGSRLLSYGDRRPAMLRRLRENGPAVLVPLAWTFVTAAHLDLVADRTLLVAHLVMDAILVAFTALSWREMDAGVLRAWRAVMVVGLAATLAGTAGLAADSGRPLLRALALYGWMLLPAAALSYTGRAVAAGAWIYYLGTACCLLGALLYAAAGVGGSPTLVAGLALVGVGQTAGILDAVLRY